MVRFQSWHADGPLRRSAHILGNSDWRTRAAVTPICLDSNGVDPIIHDLFGLRVQRVGVTGSPNAPIRVA
ncbi:hypothetical protein Y032_0084g1720 [Ancylostoma ceylanicum]|uniref:Uncharacterized protein n=1 Tax=Ancylostoma ceylanicum TaxID=53326 RepID=A0A016TQU0_9BILA|nr:hypothetical protein Y032_0084g1720 [Ancylostoma ceylanicum]